MTMDLIEIPKNPEKEVFTVRHNGKYYAVITGDETLYVSSEVFDSPLKASNHARAIKRELKITVNIKKQQKTGVSKNTSKISKRNRLYTEAEMASQTNLRFREVWLIVSPDNRYVCEVLKNNSVAKYATNKDNAHAYKTYEEAMLNLKTLDMVIRKGHRLVRFFVEKN